MWDLGELPRRLAVLGGGPSGVELAQAFARLGSAVTLLERAERLLPGFEAEAGALVREALEAERVEVVCSAEVVSAERGALRLSGGRSVAFDRLLCVTGRRANSADLGLDAVGVQIDAAGWLHADERLRTTGDRIWAAGDVLGGPQFTHVAGHQGVTATLNTLLRARRRFDSNTAPRVVFTDPQVAAVGLSESEARLRLGRDPELLRHDYGHSDRAIAEGTTRGLAKLVCDRRGRLLGATVVAPQAAESAALLGALVGRGAKAGDLAQIVFPYPTYSEGPARAAEGWWAQHRLTPRTRRLLGPAFAALRAIDRPRSDGGQPVRTTRT